MTAYGYSSLGGSRIPRNKTIIIITLLLIVAAWTLFSSTNLLSSNYNDDSSQQQIQLPEYSGYSDNDPLPEPPVTNLDPNTKYFSYLPFAGLTNQFIALQSAAYAAKYLNRTLILPPIVSNMHDHDNAHQRWSHYFDLDRFTKITGIPVVEWDSVRPLTHAQRAIGRQQAIITQSNRMNGTTLSSSKAWNQLAANITSEIIYGYGTPVVGINFSSITFTDHFLLRIVPVPPRPREPLTSNDKSTAPTLVVGSEVEMVSTMEDALSRYTGFEGQMLVFSHTFKLKVHGPGDRYWNEIGAHLHFQPRLVEYATMRVNQEVQRDQWIEQLPNDDPEGQEATALKVNQALSTRSFADEYAEAIESGEIDNPETLKITAPLTRIPHIAIHMRRGDIWMKCREPGANMDTCMIPIEYYVEAVARARTEAAKRGLKSRLPVVVTTDTESVEDLEKIKALGWHRIEHDAHGTAALWGSFGPAMVDAVILGHADEFVGTFVSTMSRVAAKRQRSWYDRAAIYPRFEKNQKRNRRHLSSYLEKEEE